MTKILFALGVSVVLFFVSIFFHFEFQYLFVSLIENHGIQFTMSSTVYGHPLLFGVSFALIPFLILAIGKLAPLKSAKQGAICLLIILLTAFVVLEIRLEVIEARLSYMQYAFQDEPELLLTYDIGNTRMDEYLAVGLAIGTVIAFFFYRLYNKKPTNSDPFQ